MKCFAGSIVCKFALVSIELLVVFITSLASAAPGDEHWDPQFGVAGPAGNNYAVTMHNGRIYASGVASATNVALMVWDGAQWTAQCQFYGTLQAAVYDLAFVNDTLYAAGVFTNVNGVAATNLAKWDGTNWSSVGFQKGTPYSLAVNGGTLYVGGSFTNVGAVAMKNVGSYDGAAWHALGAGLGDTNVTIVYALAATNATLYAGGVFTNSGSSVLSSNVARWDGASWSPVGGGLTTVVYSLATKGTELYAAGLFGGSGLAKFDGSSWSACGSGFNANAQSVAVLGNLVCVAGSFTTVNSTSMARFAAWNGTSWQAAGSGLSSAAVRVYSTGTNVLVGGNFLLAGGLLANGLAAWDGVNWSPIGTPGRINGASSVVNAVAGDGTNVYAGGSFTGIGTAVANYIARFDGTNWNPMSSGIGIGSGTPSIRSIVVNGINVYVGGSFSTAGGSLAPNIAVWNGTGWQAFGLGPGGVVCSILARPEGVYAAGAALNGSTYSSPFFQMWNGSSWQSVLAYNPDDTFIDFYVSDTVPGMAAAVAIGTDIYVGGHFYITWHDENFMNATQCNNIMRFDGTYARIVDLGLNNNVVAMAALGTDLYVAGPFTTAGSVSANQIAKWNGTVWSSVGGSVVGNGTVFSLSVNGGNLYASGSFTNMGGVAANRVAVWNGSSWSALGSGLTIAGIPSGSGNSVAASGNDVYVGGTFRLAGGKPSTFIGRWNSQSNFNTPQLINPQWLPSHQFSTRLMGVSGITNLIQATTDFTTWTPVLTNASGVYDFTDPSSASYPKRFYRAMLSP